MNTNYGNIQTQPSNEKKNTRGCERIISLAILLFAVIGTFLFSFEAFHKIPKFWNGVASLGFTLIALLAIKSLKADKKPLENSFM